MISIATYNRIRELLAEGDLLHSEIAQACNVSKSTVATVAAEGSTRRYAKPVSFKMPKLSAPRNYHCSQCGAMVAFPCYLCAIRAGKRADRQAGRVAKTYPPPLDTSLAEIVSFRIAELLEGEGWTQAGDVLELTPDRLAAVPQLGASSREELIAALRKLLGQEHSCP